jgi:ribonuclease P protein component
MLKKENRLTKNKDFDNIFARGRSSYGRILGIKVAPNNLSVSRFGILVGLKVSRKAVIRNKIKRQVRAIINDELFSLKIGFDCAVIVFPLILEKNYDEIKAVLRNCFARTEFYNNKRNA